MHTIPRRGSVAARLVSVRTTAHPETNVKRVALPAELVARIRAGEQVSAAEITAAQERVSKGLPKTPDNDWLPPPPPKKGNQQRRRK